MMVTSFLQINNTIELGIFLFRVFNPFKKILFILKYKNIIIVLLYRLILLFFSVQYFYHLLKYYYYVIEVFYRVERVKLKVIHI